jgi:hypothetical protein
MILKKKMTLLSTAAAFMAATVGHDASAETVCTVAKRTKWNVPNGGLVVNRSGGVVRTIMDAINEWSTHSALSHGTSSTSWISQATGKQPRTQQYCSVPLNPTDLTNTGPGASQTTVGGAYVDYFGDTEVTSQIGTRFTSGSTFNGVEGMEWYSGNNPDDDVGYYQGHANPWQDFPGGSNRGGQIADFLWNWPNYQTFATATGANNIYRLEADDGQFLRYAFNQYMNMGTVHLGNANGNQGAVCSTLHAWASWKAGQGGVLPFANYTHAEVVAGINALWGKIKNQCDNRDIGGLFSGSFIGSVTCTLGGFDLCANAANQVTNAFAVGHAQANTDWKSVRDTSTATAFTISPDCLTGYNAKCFAYAGGSSAWGWDTPGLVQWSGSTAYSCWSN